MYIANNGSYPKHRMAVIELEYEAKNACAVVKEVTNIDLAACFIVFDTKKTNFFDFCFGKCFEVTISHSSADNFHSFINTKQSSAPIPAEAIQ